jgi:tetratricopeptide (TPR) repeat protein
MNIQKLALIAFAVFIAGCGSLEKLSPFKSEEKSLEPTRETPQGSRKSEGIFVCAGDINVTYKKLGEVSLGEYGFSGHDVLARKIREKALAVRAQAVINVQYDTGASKSWQGYGELGGTDYGVKQTSWCKGTAIVFLESYDHLGLLLCDITKESRDWFYFKKSHKGALVVSALPGSIAENAGIKTEDLITELNGQKVENKRHFSQIIKNTSGKEAKLLLLRSKEVKTVTLSVPVQKFEQVASSPPPSFVKESAPVPDDRTPPPYKLQTGSADVHNEVGDLYLRKGMYRDAAEEYKKAVQSDPDSAISHFNLSIAYDKLGMKEEADEEFSTYKKLKQATRR